MAEQIKRERPLDEILYDCILELSYVQSVEDCSSELCKSPNAEELIEEGMKALGVKDLSQISLVDYRKHGPLTREEGQVGGVRATDI